MRTLLLVLMAIAFASAVVPGRALSEESKTLQATPEKKVIKDAAEYNAYTKALNLKDPAAKGAAMEEFARRYPKSAVYADALEQAMAAYQAAGKRAKVAAVAERLIQFDPKNVQALAILAFIKMNTENAAAVAEAKRYAERGLKLLPELKRIPGMSDAQFAELRRQTTSIFYDAIGLAALYAKDYPAARIALQKSISTQMTNFVQPYRLAVAELEPTPLDPEGFWYIAKAIMLARAQNKAAADKIEAYAAAKYKKYHGSMDGWDGLLVKAAEERAPPKGFTVRRETEKQ